MKRMLGLFDWYDTIITFECEKSMNQLLEKHDNLKKYFLP